MSNAEKSMDHHTVKSMLLRQTPFGGTPEARLWISVISEAWRDADVHHNDKLDKVVGNDAYRFFVNGNAENIANLIGWDGNIVEFFLKHHACKV